MTCGYCKPKGRGIAGISSSSSAPARRCLR
nr:MAG TPA: hypothetical protein [Caudoviricetes sp.]